MTGTRNSESEKLEQHLHDIKTLTRTQLKKEYLPTYNSWRNRKNSASKTGNWDPEFADFTDFLRHMGPRPTAQHSLDRIDNDNPFYGPGLCRWADKGQQANNRRTTISIMDGRGERPLSEVARQNGLHPGTLRKRRERGMSDRELIAGYRFSNELNFGKDPRRYQPWPRPHDAENQERWERFYEATGGLKKNTRYGFLISRLKQKRKELDDELLDNDPGIEEEISPHYREILSHLKRIEDELARATAEEPLWNAAVKAFEARAFEQRAMRSSSYRDYREDDYSD